MDRFQASPRAVAILKWTGIAFAGLLIAVLLVFAFVDSNAMKGPVERLASARLGRTVQITGDLEIHPWSWTPRLTASGVRIGNAGWDERKRMASIERIDLRMQLLPLLKGDLILPAVNVDAPQVYAHRDASGRANWDFGEQEKPAKRRADPVELPVIRKLVVDNGRLEIRDDVRKLVFRGSVRAREDGSKGKDPFLLEGKGELNGRAFAAKVSGGSLIGLDAGEPYSFKLEVDAADIEVNAQGVVPRPFDMAKLRVNVEASGNDMADLYYLTGLAIPNTPPYEVTAAVERDGALFRVSDLEGAFGRSDVHGELDVDTAAERPKVTGRLESEVLDLKDITALGGAHEDPKTSAAAATDQGIAKPEATTADGAAAPEAGEPAQEADARSDAADGGAAGTQDAPVATAGSEPAGGSAQPAGTTGDSRVEASAPTATPLRLFPDARLQVDRVRGMDADVQYSATTIHAAAVPVQDLSVHIKLEDGMLNLDPLTVTLQEGKVAGFAHIDARQDVPKTELDFRVADVDLEQFNGEAPGSVPPLAGLMQARVVMTGEGASLHEFVSHASGTVTAVVPHGEVRAALAELTGINVLRGLGLLLTDDQQRAEVRCGVANFEMADGVMRAGHVVLDTEDVLITGSGELRFEPEELDLALKGNPKEFRMVRLDAPIEVDGHFRDPNVHVGVGDAAKQVGIGVVLSAVIAPIAALIAFVDGGLTEDANCAALLASARESEAPPPASANETESAPDAGT